MSNLAPASGDAVHLLYRAHHGWLHSWLRSRLGNPSDAADLAQDTFVRVLRHRHELAALREPRAYLTTVAKRLVLNLYRRRSLEQAYLDALAAMPEAQAPSPEQRLLTLEALQEIDAMLAGLPRPARVVRTRQGDIQAQAARFCVQETGAACRVSVQEGRVMLGRADTWAALAAGEQAWLRGEDVPRPEPADPHAADWTRGVLHASAWRLDAFAAELGRYRPGVLRCDPEVAGLRISGAFQLHDTDAVLAALPSTLPVQVRYRSAYWVTILPRAAIHSTERPYAD